MTDQQEPFDEDEDTIFEEAPEDVLYGDAAAEVAYEERRLDQVWEAELRAYAACMVVGHMYGCRCGDCWSHALGYSEPKLVDGVVMPSCLPAEAAEVINEIWFGNNNHEHPGPEVAAIAARRRCGAPPRIDGNRGRRLLNRPKVWKTIEAITRILLDGYGDAEEPEEIARLLRCAGLPRPEEGA
jgi:hypothetical protein